MVPESGGGLCGWRKPGARLRNLDYEAISAEIGDSNPRDWSNCCLEPKLVRLAWSFVTKIDTVH